MTTTTTTTVSQEFTPGKTSTPKSNGGGKGNGKQQNQRFQRVRAEEVSFTHDGLADNSFDARVSID